ncbi:MAG: hypothetical protein ABWY25_06400 [Paenisporosarcina sp.]
MKKSMLTTIDNPFSPFDDFVAWYSYDVSYGHHSCSFLARILNDSDQLSEADQDLAIDQAIDEIVKENVSGIYRKVTKDIPD